MKAFEKEVQSISFSNSKERDEFLNDVNVLLKHPKLKRLVLPKSIRSLHFLYLSLNAELNMFRMLLNQNSNKDSNLLQKFFQEISGDELFFPKKAESIEIFIKLCDTNISKVNLRKLLKSNFLDNYPLDRIQKISEMYALNINAVIQYFSEYSDQLSKEENILVFDILFLLKPSQIDEKIVSDIYFFLKNIVPYFTIRFAHRMNQKELFGHPEKIVIWFIVWKKHQYQLEENEINGVPYYETDFPTIIKYITEYIWWNNGLRYGGDNKKYKFGSNEFFFLATGGSIRKLTNDRPYTRRMAREFTQLPFDLDLGKQHNVYLYLFGKSLGGGEKLSRSLMRFMRHPNGAVAIQIEFDKWNPVIQKFSSDEFEVLVDEAIETLMGYVYHCLRDKPNYSVQGKTIVHMMHESDAYYRRILRRMEERQRRIDERMAREKAPVVRKWSRQKNIKPLFRANKEKGNRVLSTFNIVELVNEQQLLQEGKVLEHCVGGYVHKCMQSSTSIWSLRYLESGGWKSKVTIELNRKTIVQIRGKRNSTPKLKDRTIIEKWANRESLLVLDNNW